MENAYKYATKEDIDNLHKALALVVKREKTDETQVDWENAEIQFTLMRLINNLPNFHRFYKRQNKQEEKENYYDAKCNVCGWFGSSKWCGGGSAIADTGDYTDPTCPVCESSNID